MEAEQLLQACSSREAGGGATQKVTFAVAFSSFISLSGAFAFGCAAGFSSPAESGIMHDLGLSTAEYSLFGSLMTFGSMVGAILSGKLADFMGRRGATWFFQLFFIMGWLAIAFAKDVRWLDFGRLSIGFSYGVQNFVSIMYVAEITPASSRGGFTMAAQLMVCGGITLMFFIGNIIPWRILALVGTVPCLVNLVGAPFIPESPRWLAKVGREKELLAALQWFRGKDADVSDEAAQIMASTRSPKQQQGFGFTQLLDKRYARPLIVGIGLCTLLPLAGGTGILYYASSIFEAAGCSASVGTIAMALIQIPFTVLGVLVMDKFGRRPLLMVDIGGVLFGCLLAGLAFLFQDLGLLKHLTPTMALVSLLIYFAFFTFGAGLPFTILSEIFPLDIRGSAGSLTAFTNCLSTWIVSYAFNFLIEWNSAGTFFLFASISGLSILFVWKLLPETKGLTLEEIQLLWTTTEIH